MCLYAPSSDEKEAWHTALSAACAPQQPVPTAPASSSSSSSTSAAQQDAAAHPAATYDAYISAAEAAASAGRRDAPLGSSTDSVFLSLLNHGAARYFFDLQRNARVAVRTAEALEAMLAPVDLPPGVGALKVTCLGCILL